MSSTLDAAGVTSPLESKRLRRTAAKVVLQWSLGVIAKTWAAWAGMGQAQARERNTGRKLVCRRANRIITKKFEGWVQYVVFSIKIRNKKQSALYKAFDSWEEIVKELLHKQGVLLQANGVSDAPQSGQHATSQLHALVVLLV